MMQSHWDWSNDVITVHNKEKPYAPENGQPLKFKPGDKVIYTNPEGIEFVLHVTGYYRPAVIDSLYATGSRYFLDWDCHWFPVKEENLRYAE